MTMAASDTSRLVICAVADVPESGLLALEIDGREYVVARDASGGYQALRDICPHEGARLSAGSIHRVVVGDHAGDYRLSDQCVVRCPWHGWEYDLANGKSLVQPDEMRVNRLPIEQEGDNLVLIRPAR
jgi:3-phenylpropionate/trans-cinnamate dioxygenase ferredoxin subunit